MLSDVTSTFSLLPQILSLADEGFLLEFSTAIYQSPLLPHSNSKSETIASLLHTALTKTSFYDRSDWWCRDPTALATQGYERAKRHVNTAIDLQCGNAILSAILDRVLTTKRELEDAQAEAFAELVMLPLVRLFGLNRERLAPVPPNFGQLQQETVEECFDLILKSAACSHRTRLSQVTSPHLDRLQALVDVALVHDEGETFLRVYVVCHASDLYGRLITVPPRKILASSRENGHVTRRASSNNSVHSRKTRANHPPIQALPVRSRDTISAGEHVHAMYAVPRCRYHHGRSRLCAQAR